MNHKCYFTRKDQDDRKAEFLDEIKEDNVSTMISLGDVYLKFYDDLDGNIDEAIKYYKMAIDKNNPSAMIKLGKLYTGKISEDFYPSHLLGLDKNNYDEYFDENKAKKLFDQALKITIEQDDLESPWGQIKLAQTYHGIDPQDPRKIQIYEKIVDSGKLSDKDNKLLKHNLALWYRHGQGCKQNFLKAIILYSEATCYENQGSLTNLDEIVRKLLKIKGGLKLLVTAINQSQSPIWILLELIRNEGIGIRIKLSEAYDVPDQVIIKTIHDLWPDVMKNIEEKILNAHEIIGEWKMWSQFCDLLIGDYKQFALGIEYNV